MKSDPQGHTIDHLILRPNDVLCGKCARMEPIHMGTGGVSATSYISALYLMAERHRNCKLGNTRPCRKCGAQMTKEGDCVECGYNVE